MLWVVPLMAPYQLWIAMSGMPAHFGKGSRNAHWDFLVTERGMNQELDRVGASSYLLPASLPFEPQTRRRRPQTETTNTDWSDILGWYTMIISSSHKPKKEQLRHKTSRGLGLCWTLCYGHGRYEILRRWQKCQAYTKCLLFWGGFCMATLIFDHAVFMRLLEPSL